MDPSNIPRAREAKDDLSSRCRTTCGRVLLCLGVPVATIMASSSSRGRSTLLLSQLPPAGAVGGSALTAFCWRRHYRRVQRVVPWTVGAGPFAAPSRGSCRWLHFDCVSWSRRLETPNPTVIIVIHGRSATDVHRGLWAFGRPGSSVPPPRGARGGPVGYQVRPHTPIIPLDGGSYGEENVVGYPGATAGRLIL